MIFVEKGKTDQGRWGHTVILGRTSDFRCCPVSWYERYLQCEAPKQRTSSTKPAAQSKYSQARSGNA